MQQVCCRDASWKSSQKMENNWSKISPWLEEADSVRGDLWVTHEWIGIFERFVGPLLDR